MKKKLFGYLAPINLEKALQNELEVEKQYGNLFLSYTPPEKVFFAQNVWLDPLFFKISSISDGANILKKMQRNWALYPYLFHRRASLIEEKLPYISKKKFSFQDPLPKNPLGSWTLIEKDTILASKNCSSLFPNGEIFFNETKIPPSRAYLKLYETFFLTQKMPKKDDVCLEIGASPGSWTYVLASLKAKVYCIDRSPLEGNIDNLPNVFFQKGDAFKLKPSNFPKIDWFFSDLICFPEKLYDFILPWLDICDNFICTLKFKGIADHKIIEKFSRIENSKIYHLFHNKNELTWIRLKNY